MAPQPSKEPTSPGQVALGALSWPPHSHQNYQPDLLAAEVRGGAPVQPGLTQTQQLVSIRQSRTPGVQSGNRTRRGLGRCPRCELPPRPQLEAGPLRLRGLSGPDGGAPGCPRESPHVMDMVGTEWTVQSLPGHGPAAPACPSATSAGSPRQAVPGSAVAAPQ